MHKGPKDEEVTARLTAPVHTHAHIYTQLRPAPLYRQQRTHPRPNPKITKDTHIYVHNASPTWRERGSLHPRIGRGAPGLVSATRSSHKARLFLERPPPIAKPPTGSTRAHWSELGLARQGGNPLMNRLAHRPCQEQQGPTPSQASTFQNVGTEKEDSLPPLNMPTCKQNNPWQKQTTLKKNPRNPNRNRSRERNINRTEAETERGSK